MKYNALNKMSGRSTPVAVTAVPLALRKGVPMLKISSKKIKQVIVRIEDDAIMWSSMKGSKIPISQIRELRLNQPPANVYTSHRWITVVYAVSNQWKVLHITALTDDVYDLWVKTLTALVSETSDRLVSQVTPTDPDLMWIRQLWPAGAKTIDFGTAAGLCGTLGLVIPQPAAAEFGVGRLPHLAENKIDNQQSLLDLNAFRKLLKKAQTRPELDDLYRSLTMTGPLDRTGVYAFLVNVQKLDPGHIFDQFQRGGVWTLDSLTEFLLSPTNSQSRIAEDMTRPLTEYFISSSHNTYLVGEQWRGESTVEGYIRVLLARCRCVEMDCHDGDAEPEVFHKKTLTSKVSARDICQAIATYAFVSSPYPVIISAEIHCSLEQQERLATIMLEVFGERLVTAPLDGVKGMPSPEQLKGRILFKAKPPPVGEKAPRFDTTPSDVTSSTESESGFSRLARRLSINSSNSEKASFAQSLLDLLVYTAGVKYQGFSKLVEYEPRHQFSVSERTAERIVRDQRADWIKHNYTHITRIYPRGFRLGSSNYNPTSLWAVGCQLVALNWQTVDEGMVLNHAMFRDTPGYVLKPPALREKVVEKPARYRMRVSIISAQRIPPSSDVFVEATLTDEADTTFPVKRTASIKGPALNPIWNEQVVFEHTTTESMLALTFLHLRIKNRGLVAQWVKSISAAPRGYHHLPLYDPLFSRFVFATLFVRIDVQVV